MNTVELYKVVSAVAPVIREDVLQQLKNKNIVTPPPIQCTEQNRTNNFIGRFPTNSPETDEILKSVKEKISSLNKVFMRENCCIRLHKRGRKPKAGFNYGWGGTLSPSKAKYFDLYIGVESKW